MTATTGEVVELSYRDDAHLQINHLEVVIAGYRIQKWGCQCSKSCGQRFQYSKRFSFLQKPLRISATCVKELAILNVELFILAHDM